MAQIPLIFDCVLSATGTAASAIRVTDTARIVSCVLDGEVQDILVLDGATAQVSGNEFDVSTLQGSGVLEPLQGDRSAWDALDYAARHTNDTDSAAGIHHSWDYLSSIFVAKDSSIFLTNELDYGSIFIGGPGNLPQERSVSGDASISDTGTLTLTTVNADVGTFGDEDHLAQITVDAKGRITAIDEIVFSTGEVLMAESITPPSPLLTEDETDWLYTE